MKIIQEELGSPIESFFSYISEEPVAAASFGQVSLHLKFKKKKKKNLLVNACSDFSMGVA